MDKQNRLFLLIALTLLFLPLVSAGIIINSPLSNSNILNTLSTTLNVTNSGGFNTTITYSWTNGFKNYTLCNNCTSTNYTVITFPRQSYYNLSVWATNSSGFIQSNISNNLFVGNKDKINVLYDNTINDGDPDVNYASVNTLYVEDNRGGGGGDTRRVLFYTNFSNYTNIQLINSSFTIYLDGVSSFANNPLAFYKLNASWNESGVTWNKRDGVNNWAIAGGTYNSTILVSKQFADASAGWFSFILNKQIDDWFDNSSNNFGILFSDTADSGGNYYNFESKENTNKPYFNITYYTKNIVSTITNTLTNNSNFSISNVNFIFNISDDNDYLTNISLFIDGIRNSTVLNQPITANTNNSFQFNVTNIPDGNHTWFIQAYDSDGVQSNSSLFNFRIDTTPPTLNWLSPTDDGLISISLTNYFNYSVIDSGIGLSSCWWSNSSGLVNHTISCNTNITDIESTDGNYNITIWSNDSLNNINSIVRKFQISINDPMVSLNSPLNNQWFNTQNNILFNFSVTHANPIINCSLYGNWTGTWLINQTNSSSVSNLGVNYDFNPINITDGNYIWNVKCIESGANRVGWYGINRTFGIDTVYPISNITAVQTTQGSQTVNFNSTASDTNLGSCKYNVINSTGSYDIGNTTFTCNSNNTQFVVSGFATYNLTIYHIDLAGNENSTTQSFTTIAGGGTTIIGGDGGVTTTILQSALPASNYSFTNNLLDLVLAKGSVTPRKKTFTLTNKNLMEIPVYLACSTENLTINQTKNQFNPNNINICDYVNFKENNLILSANELTNTQGTIYIKTPENASFGDVYSFNLIAVYNASGTDMEFAKLSVQARVPFWGLIYKYSLVPKMSGHTYPVAPFALLFSFILFGLTIFILHKLPLTSFLVGILVLFLSFISLLIFL